MACLFPQTSFNNEMDALTNERLRVLYIIFTTIFRNRPKALADLGGGRTARDLF